MSTATPAVNWRATLYANSCSNVDIPTSDFGLGTTRYCPSSQSGSCECSGVATVDVAVAAACLGFLFFNRHPAKVFMGDTGALTLGAVVAGSAILIGNHLLLLLIGGVFVVEALSVILQVAYFKMTRKRIFKMSPLHHHYELSGWPEHKITNRFWAAALVLALAGFAVGR